MGFDDEQNLQGIQGVEIVIDNLEFELMSVPIIEMGTTGEYT